MENSWRELRKELLRLIISYKKKFYHTKCPGEKKAMPWSALIHPHTLIQGQGKETEVPITNSLHYLIPTGWDSVETETWSSVKQRTMSSICKIQRMKYLSLKSTYATESTMLPEIFFSVKHSRNSTFPEWLHSWQVYSSFEASLWFRHHQLGKLWIQVQRKLAILYFFYFIITFTLK